MPATSSLGFVDMERVDTNHAGETVTQCSRTGFRIYVKSAPVYWMLKKNTSFESSSFGSEFYAMEKCCEYIHGI